MPRTYSSAFTLANCTFEILARESTRSAPRWVLVHGLESLEITTDSDTTDTSPAESLWAEPLVTKRRRKFKIKGRRIYVGFDGSIDPGQSELDHYAFLAGYEADTTVRVRDPQGAEDIIDVIVADMEQGVDLKGYTVTWSLEEVGINERPAYIQLAALSILRNSSPIATLVVPKNTSVPLTVALTPSTATNQKISVISADTTSVAVENHTGLSFSLYGLKPTTSPVRVVVRAMNNQITKELQVTVE